MKFQLLPLGARFEYQGKVYVKTGPMTASSDQGGQRMIPRFATLQPLDGVAPAAPAKSGRKLDEARVLAAFEVFYQSCVDLPAAADAAQRQTRMEAARQQFLSSLEKA